MRRLVLLIVILAICAAAGCKKEIVENKSNSVAKVRDNVGDGFAGLLGAATSYNTNGDSIFFRSEKEYKVFVPDKDGKLVFYRYYKEGEDTYECTLHALHGECVHIDENGVIVDRERYNDGLKGENPLEAKLQGIYKKAKAACKE